MSQSTHFLPEASHPSVLLVDDDFELRSALADALTDFGWRVRSAASGTDALQLLRSWHPDLILLDLLMPSMDGWAFREEAARRNLLQGVPLVLISATSTVH